MRVLAYSVNTLMKIVNFGAELDLIKSHIQDGDEVYVLGCKGQLHSCHTNSKHLSHKCFSCKRRFQKGLKRSTLPESHCNFLSEEDVDYSVLPDRFECLEALQQFSIDGINFGFPVIASIVMELKDHKFESEQAS